MVNHGRPESISTIRHGTLSNAHQFSPVKLSSLRKKAEIVTMDFDVYCRSGETGYFYPEDEFLRNEKQAVKNGKKIKIREQKIDNTQRAFV